MVQLLPLSLLLASSQLLQPAWAAIDCKKIVVDSIKWDISALGGDFQVSESNSHGDVTTNTTFHFNLCKPIERLDRETKTECLNGAWACAHREKKTKGEKEPVVSDWSVAGTFAHDHGGTLEDHQTRLKGSKSHEDSQKGLEGLQLEYNGGKVALDDGREVPVQMLVELRCNRKREDEEAERRDDEEGDDDGKKGLGEGPKFLSYETEPVPGSKKNEKHDVLRLVWDTIHACEDEEAKEEARSKGWGFFTWMIIILFLLVASYLIFGSWLNYNRHGARGWDLLPHGDTIRDIPYLVKDWGRRVVDTVQGDGRGGYNQI